MKKLSPVLIFLLLLFLPVKIFAESSVSNVNSRVAAIDKAIADGEYPVIILENDMGPTEGVPPIMHFYYELETEQLVAAIMTAGHETWSKTFSYYYDGDENIQKYLVVIDRYDNPPREAVIYDRSGEVLWKNTELPISEPKEIRAFFRKAMSFQDVFSRY